MIDEPLPDEEVEAMRAEAALVEERRLRLAGLALSLAKSRSDAISAREASGIEVEWLEDEEHYEGIDDANRGEHRAWRQKPMGQSEVKQESTGSTVFLNITRPYCDAASARVSDMLLPTDDRAWALSHTIVPDLVNISKGQVPLGVIRQINTSANGDGEMAKSMMAKAVEDAARIVAEAKQKSDKAQKRIEDWHSESQFHAEVRSVIEDTSKLGTGVLKGPVPEVRRHVAYVDGALVVRNEISPASRRISAWNLFPDRACGENIHNGSYIWERDDISPKRLADLKGAPGYLDDEIDAVLEEGPCKASKEAPEKLEPDGSTKDKSSQFEIWYYHGVLDRDAMEAAGCQCDPDKPVMVPAQITMVNNRVIKAVLNPLDTGDFPYDVMVWQKRSGHWAGIGVSRQIRTPQRVINAAGRNMMDNAGRAGGPQLVIKQGVVTPHDGVYEVTPWKIWLAGPDSDLQHMENAFRFVTIPMLQAELMEIIRFGLKLAEDVTGLPLLLQGQQGKAPDTLGGMQMLNNNASTVLRRIARLFDDLITEPHVRRYYRYLLQYGEDDEKGDFVIDARGSSALVERDIQNQQIPQILALAANPVYGWDPKKAGTEWLKSMRFDPKRFEFDDEKWQKIVENMAQGQQDPRLAVAQLRADTDAKITQMEQAFTSQENQKDREMELMLKGVDAELDQRRQAGQENLSLADIKAMLTGKVMDIRARHSAANEEMALKRSMGSGI